MISHENVGRLGASRWGLAWRLGFLAVSLFLSVSTRGATNVHLTDVPDYEWFVGCFGTASGNLMGYWDRHGFPDFYTGPTGDGVAPLNSFGANNGIRSLWASQAGMDGRPADKPGHVDDYFFAYSSTEPDPYITQGRAEHEPDCLGDFIGLSQMKWHDMNGECDGNIDAYSFVYWDRSGERRMNFTPGPEAGLPAVDVQSGLREWTRWRGFTADVCTQLSDFNPEVPPGKGFSFQDLKAEIDAGFPVLMFLQHYESKSRLVFGVSRANPLIHGVLAYGYFVDDAGTEYVRFRTSYAGGDNALAAWNKTTLWSGIAPLRGVITYHPLPQITSVTHVNGQLTIRWNGPRSQVYDEVAGSTSEVHWYVIEKATSLTNADYTAITYPTTENAVTIPVDDSLEAFYRVRLVSPPDLL